MLTSIVDDLPPVFKGFYQDIKARTCPQCGEIHPGKQPPKGWVTLTEPEDE
jgi:3-hydroxyanthranilate 3,4-dioxygenase